MCTWDHFCRPLKILKLKLFLWLICMGVLSCAPPAPAFYFGPWLLFSSSWAGSVNNHAPSSLTASPVLIPPASLLNVSSSPFSSNSSMFLEHSFLWLAFWLLLHSVQSYQRSLFYPCTQYPLSTTLPTPHSAFSSLFSLFLLFTPCHIYNSSIRALMFCFFLCSQHLGESQRPLWSLSEWGAILGLFRTLDMEICGGVSHVQGFIGICKWEEIFQLLFMVTC